MSVNMNEVVGRQDVAFLVLDALRFDVAEAEFQADRLPNLAALLPQGWEKRHSPGCFTYPAHQAFFAGFLPTPADAQAPRDRLFASAFEGSETSGPHTCIFDQADIVSGFRNRGYHSICIGGVGFFNKRTPLSRVFPAMFDESHWTPEMGVTGRESTKLQFQLATDRLQAFPPSQRLFLFINISAIHQPNCHYLDRDEDDLETHAASLRYVDSQLPLLLPTLQERGTFLIVCSDHGTLYGEDGFVGHRVGHEAVYTVPYGDALLESERATSA